MLYKAPISYPHLSATKVNRVLIQPTMYKDARLYCLLSGANEHRAPAHLIEKWLYFIARKQHEKIDRVAGTT